MPDKQTYHLTIGYKNGQSVQALTYQDRKSVMDTLKGEADELGLVHLTCHGKEGDLIDVDVTADDIQLIMHQKYMEPERKTIAGAPRIFQ